jgi:hypothetical protein
MVQRKIVSFLFLLSYLVVSVAIILYLYCYTQFTDWVGLISLLLFGGLFVLEGLGQILKILRDPRLKIMGSGVKTDYVDTKDEFKDVYFVVVNEGKREAQGCRVKVKIKGISDDFEVLKLNFPSDDGRFNIEPNERKPVSLCHVEKKGLRVSIPIVEHPYSRVLEKGQNYQLQFLFFGKNIEDRQVHRLRLDLSSWENVGIRLDC